MADESTKRAAQEYLAAKLSKEGQEYEDRQNREAAEKLGPDVWKRVAETVTTKCREWNATVGEQTFSLKETIMGDLRILCRKDAAADDPFRFPKATDHHQKHRPAGT